jgi:hypothetical protein
MGRKKFIKTASYPALLSTCDCCKLRSNPAPANQRYLRYERIENATVRMDRGVFLVRRKLQDCSQVAPQDDRQFDIGGLARDLRDERAQTLVGQLLQDHDRRVPLIRARSRRISSRERSPTSAISSPEK